MPLVVRDAISADAVLLAPRLRAADRAEIAARSGESAQVALVRCAAESIRCYSAVEAGGSVLAMFGVIPDPDDPRAGLVWMLAAEALAARHRWQVARSGRHWVEVLGRGFDRLWNHADARNTLHLRYLEHCRFTLGPTVALGPEQRPFVSFERCMTPHRAP